MLKVLRYIHPTITRNALKEALHRILSFKQPPTCAFTVVSSGD